MPETAPALHHNSTLDHYDVTQQAYIPTAYGGNNTSGSIDIATACNAHGSRRYDFESETFIAIDVRNLKEAGQVAGTLQSKSTGRYSLNYQPCVAFDYCAAGSERTRIVRSGEYAQMIAGRPDAIAFDRTRGTSSGSITGPLRKCGAATEGVNDAKADTQCVAFTQRGRDGQVSIESQEECAYALRPSPASSKSTAVAFTERTRADGRNLESQSEVAYALTNPGKGGRAQERCIAFQQDATDKFSEGIAPTMRGKSNGGTRAYGVAASFGVRRLSPVECEALQAFPSGWTAVLGERATRIDDETIQYLRCQYCRAYGVVLTDEEVKLIQSDSARYKQLGNAVCVSVIEWIGKRLKAVVEGCEFKVDLLDRNSVSVVE